MDEPSNDSQERENCSTIKENHEEPTLNVISPPSGDIVNRNNVCKPAVTLQLYSCLFLSLAHQIQLKIDIYLMS